MDLKDRKLILNLPKYGFGLSSLSFTTGLPSTGAAPQLPDEKMGLLKMENSMLKSGQFISNGNGGLEAVTKAAPKSGVGSFLKSNAAGIASTASAAFDFANMLGSVSKNNYTSDLMMGSGGTTQQNINGVGYTEERIDESGIQRLIDATAGAATMSGIKSGGSLGAAAGSLFGPVGGAIGGVAGSIIGGVAGFFGGGKAKEEAERQLRIARNRTRAANSQRRDVAYTTGLRNQFNRDNETDTSQSLFHAALGKEKLEVNPVTGKTFLNTLRFTSRGPAIGPQGGWGTKGEIITDDLGYGYEIPTGPNDTAKIDVDEGGSVYSLRVKNPSTGNSVAHDAKILLKAGNGKMSISDKNWLDMNLYVGKMMMYAGKRKENPFPGYLGGTFKKYENGKESVDLGNIALLGNAYMTAAQRDARALGLRATKSFVANPYEQDSLQQLNSLHSDYYPVWSLNREIEGRGRSSIAQSGGLSAGQRMLGYMGLANRTQQNNMAALFEHQERENALRAQDAKASLEAGNLSATRQQQAYQWDEDMLARSHAAQDNKLETSASDRQNAIGSFLKNMWERNQFNQMMNLYRDDQKIEKGKIQAMINEMGANKTPSTITGVAGNAAMLQVDPITGKFARINPFSASQLLSDDAKKSMDSSKNYLTMANSIYNNVLQKSKMRPKRRASKKGGKK